MLEQNLDTRQNFILTAFRKIKLIDYRKFLIWH